MNTPSLPLNPSLELDRKSAAELLEQARSGDSAALDRFRAHHPRFEAPSAAPRLALDDALLVIAREHGFSSWARWKEFARVRSLDVSGRAAELVRAACSGNVSMAARLLDAEPELARFDAAAATACGEAEHLGELLRRDPSLVGRKLGPNDRELIVYACFSRFLRSDRRRAAGVVRCVRLLLEAGADANAHYFVEWDGHRELLTCLYGAAGIANDAELTKLLLDHGALVRHDDREVLYHTAEFRDVGCLALVLAACPPAPAWRGPVGGDHPGKVEGIVSYCLGRALDFDNEAAALLFLQHGADPNQRVSWNAGRSHLHKAAMNGRSTAVVTAMLERGGDFNLADDLGMTPYRYAVRFGHRHLVELFGPAARWRRAPATRSGRRPRCSTARPG